MDVSLDTVTMIPNAVHVPLDSHLMDFSQYIPLYIAANALRQDRYTPMMKSAHAKFNMSAWLVNDM